MTAALIERGKDFLYIFTHGLSGVICAIAGFILVIAWWMIFVKAGEYGWKVLIPVYGTFLQVKIVDGKGIRFLLLLIPFYNIYYHIHLCLKLAEVFGKSRRFGVGILLLPSIFVVWLGFSDLEYKSPDIKQ